MKRAFISLFFFISLASVSVGQSPNQWFKTRWVAPASGTIVFPAMGGGYTLKYERINPATGAAIGSAATISGAAAGRVISGLTAGQTYRIYAYGGTFKQISFSTYPDNKDDIIAVEQWGATQWSTMLLAFERCSKIDVTATDKPNLSACEVMSGMFAGCSSLVNANSSITNWATQHIKDMGELFSGATSFNKPLNWDVINVKSMSSMFKRATSFNSTLTFRNMEKVSNMSFMFSEATSFNQPLNWQMKKIGRAHV